MRHHSCRPPPSPVGNGSLMTALDAGCVRTLWSLSHTYALVKGHASFENVFTPLFSFSSYFCSFHTFLPVHNIPQAFPFIKLPSINHDLHLHLSGFSPLRKSLPPQPRFSASPAVPHYHRPSSTVPGRPPLSWAHMSHPVGPAVQPKDGRPAL